VHRATLGGLAPGLLVDYSYTVETLSRDAGLIFFASWSVTTGRPTERSRFILDVPASLTPRIRERNISFERQMSVAHGRRVYEWATPTYRSRRCPNRSLRLQRRVRRPRGRLATVVGGRGALVRGLVRDRYTMTPALDAAPRGPCQGRRDGLDSLRAVHRWVAQDFATSPSRWVLAGYQPREPAAILRDDVRRLQGQGDAVVALAQRMGFHAYPVLHQRVRRH